MIETGIRRAPDTIAVSDGGRAADGSKSHLAVRLWTLLHAQALLRGATGAPGDAWCIEDDRPRLAARQHSTYRP
jgi:hypothetical protein